MILYDFYEYILCFMFIAAVSYISPLKRGKEYQINENIRDRVHYSATTENIDFASVAVAERVSHSNNESHTVSNNKLRAARLVTLQ